MKDILVSLLNFSVFAIDKKRALLSHVNLNIQTHTFYSVLGQNGSGKSTLLRCLQQTSERFAVEGKRQTSVTFIPFLPQQLTTYFVGETVLEELILQYESFLKEHQEISVTEMYDHLYELADKLHIRQHLNTPITQLSGGQQQLVALAAALLCRSPLILIDEMTAMLDIAKRDEILQTIREIQQERELTVIYVTHDATEVEPTDTVILVKSGEVSTYSYTQWQQTAVTDSNIKVLSAIKPYSYFTNTVQKNTVDLADGTDLQNASLVVQNIETDYMSRLKDETYSFARGSLTIISGANGSGKSTLVKVIAGEVRAVAGTIQVGNKDIAKVREQISYCPQFIDHYWAKETVYEECLFMLEVHQLLAKLGSSDEVKVYISDYLHLFGLSEIELTANIYTLSMGQQRRLALALSFIVNKDWIILDEPYAYLDTAMKQRLTEHIDQAVKHGVGVLLISHEKSLMFSVPVHAVQITDKLERHGERNLSTMAGNRQSKKTRSMFHPLQLLVLLFSFSSAIMLFAGMAELALLFVALVALVYVINPKQAIHIYRLTLLFGLMMSLIGVIVAVDIATWTVNQPQLSSYLMYCFKLVNLMLLYAPILSLITPFRLMRALQQVAQKIKRIKVEYLYMLVVLFRFIAILQRLWSRIRVVYDTKYKLQILKRPISFLVHYVREMLLSAEATIINYELRQPLQSKSFMYRVSYERRDIWLLAVVLVICTGLAFF